MDQATFRKMKSLLEPCQTPEELDRFLTTWVGISLPWDTVDENSSSSPLKLIWQVNHVFLTNEGPTQHVVMAARNSYKTVDAALIQFISMLHYRRDGAHIASIMDQSLTTIRYIDQYMNIPELLPFRKIDNVRLKQFINLPPNDFTNRHDAVLRVVTATKKGANSPRASCFDGSTEVSIFDNEKKKISVNTISGVFKRFQKKQPIIVLSVNPITGAVEHKPVTNVFRREELDRLVITTKLGKKIECTKDHWIATGYNDNGLLYQQADALSVGDKVYIKRPGSSGSLRWPSAPECKRKYVELMSFLHPDYHYKRNSGSRCVLCHEHFFSKTGQRVCQKRTCQFDYQQTNIQLDTIEKIETKKVSPTCRQRWVYDITVEDNHNFFANQVLVHNCLTLDEVDLTPQNILDEVAFVADPTRGKNRFRPVYVYLSSRKTNNGPIQNLAQKAERQANDPNKRIKLHKWSHADMLERCPPEVHKPEFGIQVAYLNQETLEIIWGHDEFLKQVAASSRAAFSIIQAYEGCKTCPAFIACRGFSVKQQADTTCLRDRQFIGDLLEAIQDPSVVAAQSLNLRPETGGIVFKTFNRAKHVADKIDFYRWITGEYFRHNGRSDAEMVAIEENGTEAEINDITPTKVDIYRAMVSRDWTVFSGVDFGYDPDPAVCIIGGYHKKTKRVGIINTIHANRYANNAWAEFLEANIFPILKPDWVAPDLADKSSPTYFKKTPALTTKPSRIITGISHIRGLLWNPVTQNTTFKILDDSDEFGSSLQTATPGKEPGNLMLISAMEHHQHQKVASTGLWDSNKFADDIFTHSIDALRYGLAPVVEDATLVYGFENDPTVAELLRDASTNPEAHKKLMEANRVEEAIKSFFKEQHGIEGLDLTPSKSRPNEDNENLQAGRKAKLVFSFD